jgi:pimeloyl-ACP methyl ester carboxylesterase
MFTQIGDCNVNYEMSGEGNPLMLLHGTGADAQSMEELTALLAKEFKVYAYDLRGFGKTVRPADPPLSHDLWVEDLRNFMLHFGISKASLAGWSLGGGVIMGFAIRYPDMVSHLIPIGAGSPRVTSTDRSGFNERQRLAESGAPIEEIVEKTFEFTKNAHSPWVVENKPERVEKMRQTLLRNDPRSYAESVRATRGDFGPKLGSIDCPTLIIVGDSDKRTPKEMSEDLNMAIPNSYLKIIEHCGHYYGFEQPEATSQIMSSFLKAFS